MGMQFQSWQDPLQCAGTDAKGTGFLMLDYYQRPFQLLHQEAARIYRDLTIPHPIRNRFWQFVPRGQYASEEGRVLLKSYTRSVEAELANFIGKLSLAYCLHLYRRLAPRSIGIDRQRRTIGLTRAVLEAAIQKYARFQLCNKIAESSTTPIDKVLCGLLMTPEFEFERKIIAQMNQLVLTDFSSIDLAAFYDLERLAYEIWRTAAALRTTGKGAPLIVGDPPECFADARSSELNFLVTKYDQRIDRHQSPHSAQGVVFSDASELSAAGCVFTPTYNVGGVTTSDIKELFDKLYKIKIEPDIAFNFAWFPFNLREYRKAHLPLASAFYEKYGVSLDAVLTVVAALSFRVFYSWHQTRGISFFRYWQRAYEGPCPRQSILEEISQLIPAACETMDIKEIAISSHDIESAVRFWELDMSKRREIDLSYSGPHYVFLPVKDGHVFIDYAWIHRRLHDLFIGIRIPDQRFKGSSLESIISKAKSALPTKPCKADTDEKRQIDYAVACDSHLVIAECKAVGMSIAFDRGEPQAIKYRTNNVIERGLSEVDDKARWLATHPVGTNYDVTNYEYVLPVVISPFVEFIPSRDTRYWVSKDVPRVLTPTEFENLLNDAPTIRNAFNRVPLRYNVTK
jgi:hypothetical protein